MSEVLEKKSAKSLPSTARIASASMTRRQLLSGTGKLALLAMLPAACTTAANLPWADGTFWDDGLGWKD